MLGLDEVNHCHLSAPYVALGEALLCEGKDEGPGYEHPVEYPHSQRAHFPVRTIAKLPHSGHSSPV